MTSLAKVKTWLKRDDSWEPVLEMAVQARMKSRDISDKCYKKLITIYLHFQVLLSCRAIQVVRIPED